MKKIVNIILALLILLISINTFASDCPDEAHMYQLTNIWLVQEDYVAKPCTWEMHSHETDWILYDRYKYQKICYTCGYSYIYYDLIPTVHMTNHAEIIYIH